MFQWIEESTHQYVNKSMTQWIYQSLIINHHYHIIFCCDRISVQLDVANIYWCKVERVAFIRKQEWNVTRVSCWRDFLCEKQGCCRVTALSFWRLYAESFVVSNSKSIIKSDTVIRNSIRTSTHIFLIFIITTKSEKKEHQYRDFF